VLGAMRCSKSCGNWLRRIRRMRLYRELLDMARH
jgi:hypothetical protein